MQNIIKCFNVSVWVGRQHVALNNDNVCTLNKANTNNEHCSFLDHDIYIIDRKLNTNIYD